MSHCGKRARNKTGVVIEGLAASKRGRVKRGLRQRLQKIDP